MSSDLFDYARNQRQRQFAPLAVRMRPNTLDQFVGQEHIIGPGKLLRRAIEADQLTSIILWGPPGTGKTTLANIIANSTRRHFSRLNAVTSGVKDLRELIAAAQDRMGMYGQGTVLFIDEIHRWNKTQQDGLLPFVEDGTVVLIGSTTENPFFSLVNPLLSRSRVFQLKSLTEDDIVTILNLTLDDTQRGLGNDPIRLTEDAARHLAHVSGGDARSALNALELAVNLGFHGHTGQWGHGADTGLVDRQILLLNPGQGDVHRRRGWLRRFGGMGVAVKTERGHAREHEQRGRCQQDRAALKKRGFHGVSFRVSEVKGLALATVGAAMEACGGVEAGAPLAGAVSQPPPVAVINATLAASWRPRNCTALR